MDGKWQAKEQLLTRVGFNAVAHNLLLLILSGCGRPAGAPANTEKAKILRSPAGRPRPKKIATYAVLPIKPFGSVVNMITGAGSFTVSRPFKFVRNKSDK